MSRYDRIPPVAGAKYVPPAARRAARGGDDEEIRLRRRLTGLINRLSDPNLAQVAGEVLSLLDVAARKSVTDIVTELILQVEPSLAALQLVKS